MKDERKVQPCIIPCIYLKCRRKTTVVISDTEIFYNLQNVFEPARHQNYSSPIIHVTPPTLQENQIPPLILIPLFPIPPLHHVVFPGCVGAELTPMGMQVILMPCVVVFGRADDGRAAAAVGGRGCGGPMWRVTPVAQWNDLPCLTLH
jgi:hypothetical protein